MTLLQGHRGSFLEKIVQQMAGASSGNGAPPSDDEMERLLELAMAEPDKPLNRYGG